MAFVKKEVKKGWTGQGYVYLPQNWFDKCIRAVDTTTDKVVKEGMISRQGKFMLNHTLIGKVLKFETV